MGFFDKLKNGLNKTKTSFDEKHKNDYLITTVGKIVFNSMFPEDFPYINEVSKENFVSTPDKYLQDVMKASLPPLKKN